ncbi:sugar kinase [Basfia succiniciproducens]|uniref:sugar kinase n=1 Tax=Basfia succiniciproducens TaxID=653940 RepID=UPI0008BDF23A|nr:sugar kinase [Basfia succiniciproducens]SEQ09134.1 2-dehydro-3-deoxygluconokinase [Basfia succiniciproducens]
MLDIISFGEPMYEFSQLPDQELNYLAGYGGDTSNFAISASRQGAKVGMLAHIGDDVFGDQFINLWQTENVNTDFVVRNTNAPTGIYFISHDEKGHHFTFYRKGSAAAAITPNQVTKESIRSAKLFHTSAITHAISTSSSDSVFRAIEIAKDSGTKVSFDTNLRLKLWPLDRARAIIHETVSLTDYCLPSLDEAILLTKREKADDIADFYLKLGAKVVVLKMGKDGAMVATENDRFTEKGHQVNTVDATGAGDCFSGAFLTQVIQGKTLREALIYANCAAALTTTGFGAVAPIPYRTQVEQFMQQLGK